MSKINRILLLAVMAVVAIIPSAAQSRLGVTVGAANTSLKFNQHLIDVNSSWGPELGLSSEITFPGIGFGLGSGIFYVMKGAQVNLGQKTIWNSLGYGSERSYFHYLQVPLHLRFKFTRLGGVEEYVAPVVYAGPTLGLMFGHNKIEAYKYSYADVGLEVGFGVEVFKNWQLTAVRNWGLTYAVKTRLLDDFTAKNRTWSFRVTYFFNRKK